MLGPNGPSTSGLYSGFFGTKIAAILWEKAEDHFVAIAIATQLFFSTKFDDIVNSKLNRASFEILLSRLARPRLLCVDPFVYRERRMSR